MRLRRRRRSVALLAPARYWYATAWPLFNSHGPSTSDPNPLELIRRLQSGCRNVFIDLGANIGIHSRFLFEPQRYPSERHPKTGKELHPYAAIFDSEFGRDRDLNATCAVAFEPNPQHAARHEQLQAAYASVGWRHIHVPAGVSDRTGSIPFHDNGGYSKTGLKNFLSFATKRLDAGTAPSTVVPVLDFAHFLGLFRLLHPAPARVLLKMDIEGVEYAVLPEALRRGVLCKHVDTISLEFHSRYAPLQVSDVSLPSVERAERHEATIRELLEKAAHDPSCRLKRVLYVDDESHKMDGQPLPS